MLFMGYKDKRYLTQSFLVYFITRLFIFHFIIAYLYEYPITQACAIIFIGLVMIAYLVIFKPFRRVVNLFQILTYETIILIINICVLVLAIMDSNNEQNQQKRELVGDIIIYCNIAFSAAVIFYICLKLVLGIISVYKIYKTQGSKKGKTACL